MDNFTASNGHSIVRDGEELHIHWGQSECLVTSASTAYHVEALREFFQAEADERLGRWRVPGHPNWVCFSTPRAYEVVVFNESEPDRGSRMLTRGGDTWPYYRAAADAYFDAHPEPKPWHAAKPGEVWALRLNDAEEELFYLHGDGEFHFRDGDIIPARLSITDGRRIWPAEVSS